MQKILIPLFLLAVGPWVSSGQNIERHSIMPLDEAARRLWLNDSQKAPAAPIDKKLKADLKGAVNLLSHLNYIPSERNQASCGNCWVWTGTGIMEIGLDVQCGILDRLSIQFESVCNTSKSCCDVGWLSDLASFYSDIGYAVPWSNANADWQNGDGTCHGLCGGVATSPSYTITNIVAQTITTLGVGQSTAIANIKNVLNQNKAVEFSFFMATANDWTAFYDFWDYQAESVQWTNFFCGQTWNDAEGGGHSVLCVGYNDEVATNKYWIMLNSWGTTSERTNGLFRVGMDLNYDCADSSGDPNLYWKTLDLGYHTSTSDMDGDGMPDDWETAHGLNPAVSNSPAMNSDNDDQPDVDEYIADTQPTNGASYFPLVVLTNPPLGTMVMVVNPTSTARVYGVRWASNLLANPQIWTLIPPEKTGTGSAVTFTLTNNGPGRIYRTGVRLP